MTSRQVGTLSLLAAAAMSGCECGPIPCKTQPTGSGDTEEVCIPGGTFLMGHEKLLKAMPPDAGFVGGVWSQPMNDWAPMHEVKLSPYFIDRYEVTWGRYKECTDAGICHPYYTGISGSSGVGNWPWEAPEVERYPATADWDDASKYCTWVGKRLPTEAEWEHAARGPKNFDYPWGNQHPSDSTFEFNIAGLQPVGSGDPEDVSPYGVHDLYGNSTEWVSDWYDPFYYKRSPRENPRGPDSPVKGYVEHEYNEGSMIRASQEHSVRSALSSYAGGEEWHWRPQGTPVWFRDEWPRAGIRCARDDRSPLTPPASGIWEYRNLNWRPIPEKAR